MTLFQMALASLTTRIVHSRIQKSSHNHNYIVKDETEKPKLKLQKERGSFSFAKAQTEKLFHN